MKTASRFVAVCGFVLIQEAWGAPSTSYGSQASEDFKENLGGATSNLHNGVVAIATPSIKFGVDQVPSVINNIVHTTADQTVKMADANRDAFNKVLVGLGHAVGSGGVLASSAGGGGMQVAGHTLGVVNSMVRPAAKAAVKYSGLLTGNSASGSLTPTNLDGTIFTALGDGLIGAQGNVGNTADALIFLINAVGKNVAEEISKVEKAALNIMDSNGPELANGALSLTAAAKDQFYTALNAFLQTLVNVQSLFDSITATINAGGSALPISVTTAADSTTTS